MDDLAEGFIKGIWRTIAYMVGQKFFEFVLYYIGWPFVKILTLGKYPTGKQNNGWYSESKGGVLTSFVGLLVLVALVVFYLKFSGYLPKVE